MLINFSNHPSLRWPENQLSEAKKKFGEVIDLPFPLISPEISTEEIIHLTKEYLNTILEYKNQQAKLAVHIMGEFTFVYNMVKELEKAGIPCYTSTTRRMVNEFSEDEKVKKISYFEFVRFRRYF